jgi:hypothetical protein
LDVCVDCGTVYSPNARSLGRELAKEIIKLDPLGALAEITEEGYDSDWLPDDEDDEDKNLGHEGALLR